VSGDGLIHEIVNGLLHRPDYHSHLKDHLTIGFIPGGTGNGLVMSVLQHTGENYGVSEAAFLIAKGRRLLMDVTELQAEYEQKTIYSFLSTAWAIIADCDINSEVIRWAGSARFTLWGVLRVFFMRKYLGSLSFNGFNVQNKHKLSPMQ
jgi:sphingosine kinase